MALGVWVEKIDSRLDDPMNGAAEDLLQEQVVRQNQVRWEEDLLQEQVARQDQVQREEDLLQEQVGQQDQVRREYSVLGFRSYSAVKRASFVQ